MVEELADPFAPAAHSEEAVAIGVGEGERVVDDVAVAVPRLAVQRVGHERVGAHHAADQRVVDPAVQVHKADIVKLLLAGEAARGLAGDVAGRVVRPVRVAPLAPGVVAQALGDGAALVGDDGDRAEVVGMEIARGDGAVGVQRDHADQGAADHQVVVPLRGRVGDQLGMNPERIEVECCRALWDNLLLETLMVDVVGKVQCARSIGDRRRLVERGVADGAAEARRLIAVGIIGEGGVDGAAADAGHRMGTDRVRAGGWIGVGADIRLRQQVADGVIGEALERRDVLAHLRRGQAVEDVVGEGLSEIVLVGIGAGEHIAEGVIRIGEVLDDVAGAGTGQDRIQASGVGIEALIGDDAVAGGLLGEMQLGVARIGGPVDPPSQAGEGVNPEKEGWALPLPECKCHFLIIFCRIEFLLPV
jgi:hypothetical protein